MIPFIQPRFATHRHYSNTVDSSAKPSLPPLDKSILLYICCLALNFRIANLPYSSSVSLAAGLLNCHATEQTNNSLGALLWTLLFATYYDTTRGRFILQKKNNNKKINWWEIIYCNAATSVVGKQYWIGSTQYLTSHGSAHPSQNL